MTALSSPPPTPEVVRYHSLGGGLFRLLAENPLITLLAVLLGVVLGSSSFSLHEKKIAIPFPDLVYGIEATSGSHQASILNLGIGYLGAPQAPVPVDVDGDLIPDVTVAVNHVNTDGPFKSNADLADIANGTVAPNIEINRYPLDVANILLTRKSPPVRINVKFTLRDLEGEAPNTVVRFGYDTAGGGSIPPAFTALVDGISTFFNPVTATIHTKGSPKGPDGVPTWYEGPLTVVAGVENSDGSLDADIDLRYSPFPDAVRVSYANDDKGDHITYRHGIGDEVFVPYGTQHEGGNFVNYVPGEYPEVDMVTTARIKTGADVIDATAAIDRMPRRMDIDLDMGEEDGRIDLNSKSDGRLPDLRAKVRAVIDGEILRARADVEELPPALHALFSLPEDPDATMSAAFTTADPDAPGFDIKNPGEGPGIGAVEFEFANFDTPTALVPYVPTERQFANFQKEGDELFAAGRIEEIRGLSFINGADGLEGHVRIGDGVLPLLLHAGIDELPGPGDLSELEATATISPLPAAIDLLLKNGSKTEALGETMKIRYEASEPVDVNTNVRLRDPAAAAANAICGQPGTACAELDIRHLPPVMEARILESDPGDGVGSETRVEFDHNGVAKPDVFIDATLGKTDSLAIPSFDPSNPVALVAHGEIRGIPQKMRVRMVEGADETLERLDFRACGENELVDDDGDPLPDIDAGRCPTLDPSGQFEIGSVSFAVRNFLTRPAGLPQAPPLAPNHAAVIVRGDPTTDDAVRFEAIGQITDISELRYANADGLVGIRSDIGGGDDLQAYIDIKDVLLQETEDLGRVDVGANLLVTPLPQLTDVCFRQSGQPLDLDIGTPLPFTAACENEDPFADKSDSGVDSSPLTIIYDASSPFTLLGDATFHADGATPAVSDDTDVLGKLSIKNIPSHIEAHVQVPTEPSDVDSGPGVQRPVRVLTKAPGASNLDIDINVAAGFGGGDCDAPAPIGDVACGEVHLTGVPDVMSALIDTPDQGDTAVGFHACDFAFYDATPDCRGDEFEIGSLVVGARLYLGDPRGTKQFTPQAVGPYAFALIDQPSDDDMELRAGIRLDGIRHASFDQAPDGFDAALDLGNGLDPFQIKVLADTRSAPIDTDGDGVLVDAEALLTPLPNRITISQHGDVNDTDDPLTFVYDPSTQFDVDARAELIPEAAGAGAKCGQPDTVCAAVNLNDTPDKVVATLAQSEQDAGGDVTNRTLEAVIDVIGAARPDITVDAVVGIPEDTAVVGGTPLVGHLELIDLPNKVTAKMASRVENTGETDETSELTALRINTPGPANKLSELKVEARNFITRPQGFPSPTFGIDTVDSPNWASVVGRGDRFQAAARVVDISDIEYVKKSDVGVAGVRVNVGGGQNLHAHVDVENFAIDELELGDQTIENALVDVLADVKIRPLPEDFSVCFREGGQPVPGSVSGDFTEACENANPFGATTPAGDAFSLDHTPLSFGYAASESTDVLTDVALALDGDDADTNTAIPTRHVKASLDIFDIPPAVTAHILQPAPDADGANQGPIWVKYDAPTPDQIDVHFSAEMTIADAICKDPRPTAEAICVSGKLLNLPDGVNLFLDPEETDPTKQNLVFTSTGDEQMDITDLALSSVKPDPDQADGVDVIVAEGQLLDLPQKVTGNLHLPSGPDDAPSVDIDAGPGSSLLGSADFMFQNFIAPDPLPTAAPAQRAGLAAPDQYFNVWQRGDALRGVAHIEDVDGVTFRTVRDSAGRPLDTSVVGIRFGQDQTIRAYADLAPTGDVHILADVTLEDVPSGISLCFRGAKNAVSSPASNQATYCDGDVNGDGNLNGADSSTLVNDDEGAIQVIGTHAGYSDGLDVDAFARIVNSAGEIFSARVDVDNIPKVIQGTFPAEPSGELDVGGYTTSAGTSPDGIGRIKVEAASFDITSHGYGADIPFQPKTIATAPFPAPSFGLQHVSGVLADGDFHAKLLIGDNASNSASRLQRVRMSPEPCPAPANNPPDYPHFPIETQTQYTCVRVDFFQTNPAVDDQLKLDFTVKDGDQLVTFKDGGITDIPSYIQLTLAKTPTTFGGDNALRPRCGFASDASQPANCMAPMLRFDQPATTRLFGTAKIGTAADVAALPALQPRAALANLDAAPQFDGSGWSSQWGADALGVRAKVATFGEGDDARTAVQAGIRLPIPQSLTVDQVQSWKSDHSDPKRASSDMRFHFVVRDSNGNPVGSLGEMTAMLHTVESGDQILLARPRPDFTRGVIIPAEVGIDLYSRDRADTDPVRTFMQIDGRLSTKVNIGARILGGVNLEAQVLNVPGVQVGDGPGEPSFRLRFELKKEKPEDKPEEPKEEQECNILLCFKVVVGTPKIDLSFDFEPTSGSPAKRIDAYINLESGTKHGIRVRGFDNITGGSPTEVRLNADLKVDPINVFFHVGIPIIGGADFVMLSDLDAGVTLQDVNSLTLRHNLLHITADSQGTGGGYSEFGAQLNVDILHGEAWGLFVKLLGVDLVPPFRPVLAPFLDCGTLGLIPTDINFLRINNGTSENAVYWPLGDPGLVFSGVLGPIFNAAKFIGPFFCLTDTSNAAIPIVDPSDPIGEPGHPVPNTVVAADPPPPPPPPAPTPPPSGTVAGALALCGTHTFTNLTVDGTLRVATSADAAQAFTHPSGVRENCPAGEEGKLRIVAEKLTVNGTLSAAASVVPVTGGPGASSFNGGAGHGGVGGTGGTNGNGVTTAGGPAYGDFNVESFASENGSSAGGANGGKGGRVIEVLATEIDNTGGTITAAGSAGSAVATGACATVVTNNNGTPGDTSDDFPVYTANTGSPGFGGGSGGGLVLAATRFDNTGGTVTAAGGGGGNGTDGGGGGGGGGVIKITAPLFFGNAPTAAGGAGGANVCSGEPLPAGNTAAPNGTAGGIGKNLLDERPTSLAQSTSPFWRQGSGVQVPFVAAAKDGVTNGFQVALCSFHLDNVTGGSLEAQFPTPAAVTAGDPCGNGTFRGSIDVPNGTDRVLFDPPTLVTAIASSALSDGYEGFYTVALRPPNASANCISDSTGCVVERAPNRVATVLGVDNTGPTISITSPANGFTTNNPVIPLNFTAADPLHSAAALSGLQATQCSNDGTNFLPCDGGAGAWELSAGDGTKTVTVRGVDNAGNVSTSSITVNLDRGAPDVVITPSYGPDGGGGWYKTRPSFNLTFAAADPNGPHATTPFVYRVDSGAEQDCTTYPSCTTNASVINDVPVGTHKLYATGVDAVGNRLASDDMEFVDFKLDDAKPSSALLTVPAAPDTAGWFTTRPWITLSAIDQLSASGVSSIRYQLNGGSFTTYTGPFQLGNGSTDLCWQAVDVAGNVETLQCRNDIQVDDLVPAAALSAIAPAPDGDAGWYKTVPVVSLSSYLDTHSGPPASDAFRYRVGNDPGTLENLPGGEYRCDQPTCVVAASKLSAAGQHLVGWSALDLVGNRRAEETRLFKIDTANPVSETFLSPSIPNGSNSWYTRKPWVTLQASDQPGSLAEQQGLRRIFQNGSGVKRIEWKLDGGPYLTYTAPFQIGEGDHAFCVRALDIAGNVESERCGSVKVDLQDPTAPIGLPAHDGNNGWFKTLSALASFGGTDPGTGSGLGVANAATCDHSPDANPAPSGLCISLDGQPYEPFAINGQVNALEGIHDLRAFTVDRAGRRSVVNFVTPKVDISDPVTVARTLPPEPARANWYRTLPRIVLRASDGEQNSGVKQIRYMLDGVPVNPLTNGTVYTGPIDIANDAPHFITHWAIDNAGRVGAYKTTQVRTDTTPPVVKALTPDPILWVWLKLLGIPVGPSTARLNYSVSDNMSGPVTVRVIVYNELGYPVRHIQDDSVVLTPNTTATRFVTWDGKGDHIQLGNRVFVGAGAYYYRVIVTDAAGNVAQSGESKALQIKLQVSLL